MHEPTPLFDQETRRAVAQRQLAVLDRVLDAAETIVCAISRQVEIAAENPERSLPPLVLASDRAARCIRLTIILQNRIMDGETFAPTPQRAAAVPESADEREDLVDRDDPLDAETFTESFETRPERERGEDYLLDRPLEEVVAVICRGLGIVPDWDRWTDAENPTPVPTPSLEAIHALAAPRRRARARDREFPVPGRPPRPRSHGKARRINAVSSP